MCASPIIEEAGGGGDAYDYAGRRTRRNSTSGTTSYVWGTGGAVAEVGPGGRSTNPYGPSELRLVGPDDRRRSATSDDGMFESTRHTGSRQGRVYLDRQGFAGEVVDHRQRPEPLPLPSASETKSMDQRSFGRCGGAGTVRIYAAIRFLFPANGEVLGSEEHVAPVCDSHDARAWLARRAAGDSQNADARLQGRGDS